MNRINDHVRVLLCLEGIDSRWTINGHATSNDCFPVSADVQVAKLSSYVWIMQVCDVRPIQRNRKDGFLTQRAAREVDHSRIRRPSKLIYPTIKLRHHFRDRLLLPIQQHQPKLIRLK